MNACVLSHQLGLEQQKTPCLVHTSTARYDNIILKATCQPTSLMTKGKLRSQVVTGSGALWVLLVCCWYFDSVSHISTAKEDSHFHVSRQNQF